MEEKIPEGTVSKAKWQDSWRKDFMDYEDKKHIRTNTLSSQLIGK